MGVDSNELKQKIFLLSFVICKFKIILNIVHIYNMSYIFISKYYCLLF
jgi:hypothetical protein